MFTCLLDDLSEDKRLMFDIMIPKGYSSIACSTQVITKNTSSECSIFFYFFIFFVVVRVCVFGDFGPQLTELHFGWCLT